MSVRALRGAIQLEVDERVHLLDGVRTLFQEMLAANGLDQDDLVSVLFTATPDLVSEFPAVAARELGVTDVPLMCAQELDIAGSLPRVVRILAYAETELSKPEIKHVYLGGAATLRRDLAAAGEPR
ncbi:MULTISPECIES: chorismate mutase [unclassified Streptomyces]|uniref:chorismate mutase n=1 Tax=Streptomyces TaxID=1883 RepID=UPI000DC7A89F|nr:MULTISPECIES: chorismate mutase [unclassified Streptomyces]AWZ07216.1 chorismate mutase [Streptomyces sp. ICC4]AWZ12759.1 chorismate mutase [Streptomyces sp. ICC1]